MFPTHNLVAYVDFAVFRYIIVGRSGICACLRWSVAHRMPQTGFQQTSHLLTLLTATDASFIPPLKLLLTSS